MNSNHSKTGRTQRGPKCELTTILESLAKAHLRTSEHTYEHHHHPERKDSLPAKRRAQSEPRTKTHRSPKYLANPRMQSNGESRHQSCDDNPIQRGGRHRLLRLGELTITSMAERIRETGFVLRTARQAIGQYRHENACAFPQCAADGMLKEGLAYNSGAVLSTPKLSGRRCGTLEGKAKHKKTKTVRA
jgi:hypothetical protein